METMKADVTHHLNVGFTCTSKLHWLMPKPNTVGDLDLASEPYIMIPSI